MDHDLVKFWSEYRLGLARNRRRARCRPRVGTATRHADGSNQRLDIRRAACLLHGDLWSGNCCAKGVPYSLILRCTWVTEADLAMTTLFGDFSVFHEAYQEVWPWSRAGKASTVLRAVPLAQPLERIRFRIPYRAYRFCEVCCATPTLRLRQRFRCQSVMAATTTGRPKIPGPPHPRCVLHCHPPKHKCTSVVGPDCRRTAIPLVAPHQVVANGAVSGGARTGKIK